jgi:hypothetical protein
MYGNSFANSIEQPAILKPPVGVLQRSVGSGIVMAMPPDR